MLLLIFLPARGISAVARIQSHDNNPFGTDRLPQSLQPHSQLIVQNMILSLVSISSVLYRSVIRNQSLIKTVRLIPADIGHLLAVSRKMYVQLVPLFRSTGQISESSLYGRLRSLLIDQREDILLRETIAAVPPPGSGRIVPDSYHQCPLLLRSRIRGSGCASTAVTAMLNNMLRTLISV